MPELGSNASTLLPEPAVPHMKWNINYLQTICNLAGVLIQKMMLLRVKDMSLYDMIKRTSNKSQETWVQILALDSYTEFNQLW